MPSSWVCYRRQRPTQLLPRGKLNKSEWLALYNEAIRLGFEPVPPSSGPPPGQPVPMYPKLAFTWFASGSTATDSPLFPAGSFVSSVSLCSSSLESLVDSEHTSTLRFEYHSAPQTYTASSFIMTPQTLPPSKGALFYIFQTFAVPAATFQPNRMYVVSGWQLYGASLASPAWLGGGYLGSAVSPQGANSVFFYGTAMFSSGVTLPLMATTAVLCMDHAT
jgi:hypothetical protein